MDERRNLLDDLRIERPAEPDRGGRVRRWVAGLATAAALVVVVGWWLAASAPPVVRTAAAMAGQQDASDGAVLDASGYVVARRQATVSSKVTARVVEVLVEEGTSVVEGEILARLDASLAERQLRLAEAETRAAASSAQEVVALLAEAERTLERSGELLAAGVTSQADQDAALAARDSLAARLAAARDGVAVAEGVVALRRQELEDTLIRAPFSGVAISKDAQPGEMISPVSAGGGFTRTGICTLVDMSSLEIEVDVNEAYIERVRPGQRVEALLDAYPDWRIPARVITSVPAADRQKATVRVRIAFERPGDPRVLPDMGVKVSFYEEEEKRAGRAGSVLVPEAALRRDGSRDVVLVLRGDRLERRAVRVAGADGGQVEVVGGLSTGERVVVDGPPDLADGDRVRTEGGR